MINNIAVAQERNSREIADLKDNTIPNLIQTQNNMIAKKLDLFKDDLRGFMSSLQSNSLRKTSTPTTPTKSTALPAAKKKEVKATTSKSSQKRRKGTATKSSPQK